MKLFKSVDDKLLKLGFIKVRENEHIISYERFNSRFGYNQCLDLCRKSNSDNIIQSYQKGVNSDGFNNVVGLTPRELKLALKKIKKLK